jgi:putative ABC transport system permease protein
MNIHPPKWADRFLEWYCNPDLLEEIQGDAYELYERRLREEGAKSADVKFVWDVLRFFRWSNIKSSNENNAFSLWRNLFNFNFKLALRHAARNRSIFAIKTIGLALSTAFAVLMMAYVLNELTYDSFHVNKDRLYRITSKVNFGDHITHFAVSPLPIGPTLVEGIPEIEGYSRILFEDKPVFKIGEQTFSDEVTFSADSNFLKLFTFQFVSGNMNSLNEPNKIVLTETLARKFFGTANALGQSLLIHATLLEVSAVIRDVPANSHLRFDALISWDTFERFDDWGNLNAYTYLLLRPGTSVDVIRKKFPEVLTTFQELLTREYKATYEGIFEPITQIHFAGNLDEDVAIKKNKSHLFIISIIAILFFITAFVNYLNLTLAEHTANVKRISIIKVFGGAAGNQTRSLFFESLFTLLIVTPATVLLCYGGMIACNNFFSIRISTTVFTEPLFVFVVTVFVLLLVAGSQLNALVIKNPNNILNALKGKFNTKGNATGVRQILVAAQLSFSIIMIALILVIVDQFNFIRNADKGLDDQNIVVIKLRPVEPVRIESFSESLRNLSGIDKIENSSLIPGILESKYVFQVEGPAGMVELLVPMMVCSPDYFEALNIKISQGRKFENDPGDSYNSYIINETALNKFGWKDAIGKKIRGPVGGDGDAHREGEVVGVVKDFNFATFHSKIEPLIIFPATESWGAQFIYVKLNAERKSEVLSKIEKEFKKQMPDIPFEWEYLDARFMNLYKNDSELKQITEIGLVISILISCLGIFSISALLLALRTREMGIRKVVGASGAQLFFLHISRFFKIIAISVVVSWPVIWFLSDAWLTNFAYHISVNAWYFVVPGMITLTITVATSGFHGVKSLLVNPIDVLKQQ